MACVSQLAVNRPVRPNNSELFKVRFESIERTKWPWFLVPPPLVLFLVCLEQACQTPGLRAACLPDVTSGTAITRVGRICSWLVCHVRFWSNLFDRNH